MKTYTFRLVNKEDLRQSIEKFVSDNSIKAGCILTCVGCLEKAVIRMAGAKDTKTILGKYEILSLVGTIEPGNSHLHISVSDENGDVIGGHLKKGSLVDTTAEIVIGELEGIVFGREFNEGTGYDELVIKPQ